MTKTMLIKVITIMGIAFVAAPITACAQLRQEGSNLRERIKLARQAWKLIKPTGKAILSSNVKNAQAVLAKIEGGPLSPGHAVVGYIKARVAFLAGQKEGVKARFVAAIDPSTAPECVLALIERSSSTQEGLLYRQHLAALLPMSVWRRQLDAGNSDFRLTRNNVSVYELVHRQTVPRGDRAAISSVAGHLRRAGLHDLAWRAYAEAVYVGFVPAWIGENREDGTWVCPRAAEYWAMAAECAYRAARKELAWAYLIKAAILGDENLYARTRATARKWNAEAAATAKPTAPRPIDPEIKRKALTQAIRAYAQLNAHPRSLALIAANRNSIEDPDKLRKEIERQWMAVVKDVSRSATKVIVYDYEVYPKGDPLKVRIPWALSDKAMTSVPGLLRRVSTQPTTAVKGQEETGPKTSADPEREKK